MIEEKFYSKKRVINIVLMLVATIIATSFLCVIKDTSVDFIIAVIFLDLIFIALLVVALVTKRQRGNLSHKQTSYGKLTFSYILSLVCLVLFLFLPDFSKPLLIITLILFVLSEESIAVYVSIYLTILMCLTSGQNFYELCSLLVLCAGGIFLMTLIKERKQQIWVCFSLMALNILVPCLFYYLSYNELELKIFIYNGISAVILGIIVIAFYVPLKTYASNEEDAVLDVIVLENYSLVCDIKAFSKFEYDHAVKVSKLSRKCAIVAGADEKICAAAGLYYRLGRMEGEPFVENGVKLAINHCFPERVIKILSEYNGEEAAISSVESAIVHMVNIVVTKIELLDRDTMSSGWNQNVVIYQTLNEISGKGLYDKSNLSMNQFLRVRDMLASEEGIL